MLSSLRARSGVAVASLVLPIGLLSTPSLAQETEPDQVDPPAVSDDLSVSKTTQLPVVETDDRTAEEVLDDAVAALEPSPGLAPDDRADQLQPDAASEAAPEQDASLALRDLALRRGELEGAERREASRILARPTDSTDPDSYGIGEATPSCSSVACVHYTTSGRDRVDTADGNGNGVPDAVDEVLAVATYTHNVYVAAGYRAPKADGGRGGNDLTDIYMADIGSGGLYGYCTSDAPYRELNRAPWDTWAYCVIDNDYSSSQFPSGTPTSNRNVTIAHEYFHAVQFAYDFAEDAWLLEATAAWVEDEIFDSVNDSRQYLGDSPMRQPAIPMDVFTYGAWSFFRFLTETYPFRQGGLPIIIRDLFEQLDGSVRGPDQYSTQGLNAVLKQRNGNLPKVFAKFASANRSPDAFYSEGKEQSYPRANLEGKRTLNPRNRRSHRFASRIDHLASATFRVRPNRQLNAKKYKVRIFVNMAPRFRGSAAIVRFRKRSGGGLGTRVVRLNKQGNGTVKVPFSRKKVKWAEITLANASIRYQCGRGTILSCEGLPKDDRMRATAKATVLGR